MVRCGIVMVLGPLHTEEKSTESKGGSPTESTQTAELIESGSADNCGTDAKEGWTEVGEKREGESRNIKCLEPQGLGRRVFSPVGKALRIWLKINSLPGNHDSSIPGLNWNMRAKGPLQYKGDKRSPICCCRSRRVNGCHKAQISVIMWLKARWLVK